MTAMSPVVLKNKGIPVKAYVIEQDPSTGAWFRQDKGTEEEPEFTVADFWIRFDNNAIADLEDEFGSLDGFEKAMEERPNIGIRAAFAAILGFDLNGREGKRAAGLKVIEGEQGNYATALGVALGIANGVDPTDAARMLESGLVAVKEMMVKRDQTIRDALAAQEKAKADAASENGSPGKTGPEPGSESDAPLLTP